MIASLTGTVLVAGVGSAVIEVGGVGIQVLTSVGTSAGLGVGETATLWTTLIVREDSLTLYGFPDSDDRDAFQILQSVSGVGPRIALAAVSAYSAGQLRTIVAAGDEAALTKISGIGKKGAQRLLLELADRLGPPPGPGQGPSSFGGEIDSGGTWQSQVRDALMGLGWSAREAEEGVTAVEVQYSGETPADVSVMLGLALRGMSRP